MPSSFRYNAENKLKTVGGESLYGTGNIPAVAYDAGYVNVKEYGALGDGRVVRNASSLASSTTITAASGVFSSADVGKTIWSTTGSGGTPVPLGTVTAYSSNVITFSNASGSSSGTLEYLYIGTNDTTAIQAAWTAAKAQKKVLFFPSGYYFVNRQVAAGYEVGTYDYIGGVIGSGSASTRLVMMPNFATTGADLSVNNGVLVNFASYGPIYVGGFSVDCGFGANTTDFSGKVVIGLSITAMTPAAYGVRGTPKVFDLLIENERNFTSSLLFNSCLHVDVENIFVYNSSYIGCSMNSCTMTVRNFSASNGVATSLQISQGEVTLLQPYIDEHTYRNLIIDGAKVKIFGKSIIYGGPIVTSQPIIWVTGSGTLELHDCEVRPYGRNVAHYDKQTPILIDSGSTAKFYGCQLTSWEVDGAKCITGAGTAVDLGENTFVGTIDVTTKRKLAYQAGW